MDKQVGRPRASVGRRLVCCVWAFQGPLKRRLSSVLRFRAFNPPMKDCFGTSPFTIMGLFTNSKEEELTSQLKQINQLMLDFMETDSETLPATLAHKFGELFEKLYKFYYPNQFTLKAKVITLITRQQGQTVSRFMPAWYWISMSFNMGLSLEYNFDKVVFRSEEQRRYANSVKSEWKKFA